MPQMIRVSDDTINTLRKIKDETGITIGKLIEKHAIPDLVKKFCKEPSKDSEKIAKKRVKASPGGKKR